MLNVKTYVLLAMFLCSTCFAAVAFSEVLQSHVSFGLELDYNWMNGPFRYYGTCKVLEINVRQKKAKHYNFHHGYLITR